MDRVTKKDCTIMLFIAIMTAAMLFGCKSTEYVPVERVRDIYHNSVDTVRDSVYLDRFRNVWFNGDTVHVVENIREYIYRYRVSNDTVKETDTLYVRYTVEKQLTRYQRFKQDYFELISVTLIFVVILLRALHKRCRL